MQPGTRGLLDSMLEPVWEVRLARPRAVRARIEELLPALRT